MRDLGESPRGFVLGYFSELARKLRLTELSLLFFCLSISSMFGFRQVLDNLHQQLRLCRLAEEIICS